MEKGIDIMMEESPGYDSRSNGEVERTVQTVQGQVRTVKTGLESRLGVRIESDHPCLPWLVQHSANLLSRYMKVEDGCTAYRRLRGREFGASVAEFGESVMYMKPDITGKDKMDARWETGVWLGMREESNESIIGTRHGCIKVRSFKRKPESDRWQKEDIATMQGVPWEVIPGHPERELKSRVMFEETETIEQVPEAAPEQLRRLYIKKADVKKYGATVDCPGCRAVVRGGDSRNHTETCRKRLEECIKLNEKDRWKRTDERITSKLEKREEE